MGKLRGNNLAGTEYTLYSNGLNPKKSSHHKHSTNREDFRRELAAVVYVSRGRKSSFLMTDVAQRMLIEDKEISFLEYQHSGF